MPAVIINFLSDRNKNKLAHERRITLNYASGCKLASMYKG